MLNLSFLKKYCWTLGLLLGPLSALEAQQYSVETILENGTTSTRINLVFLGDGYRAEELPKFMEDVTSFAERLWRHEPYKAYKAYFNVYAILTPSNESGGAPRPSEMIDNYFGSSYFINGIERLLYPTRMNKVHEVLFNNFPEYDQVIMLVNDSKYGGGGGWLAAASTHPSGAAVAIHEIGHSFSNLRDEYYAGDSFARESANMTRNNDPSTVRWKNWVNTFGIGIYQHCCNGQSSQWYKPYQNCMMEQLNRELCAVCTQTTVASIHNIVPPCTGYEPKVDQILIEADTQLFSVDLILPEPNTLTTTWTLNGTIIEQAFTPKLLLSTETLEEGVHHLSCSIYDDSPMVRIDNYAQQKTYTVHWELYKEASTATIEKTNTTHLGFRCYPNPSESELYVELLDQSPGWYRLNIIDLQGTLVASERQMLSEQAPLRMEVGHLKTGAYSLVLTNELGESKAIRWMKFE